MKADQMIKGTSGSPSKVSDIDSSTFPTEIGDPDDYVVSPSSSNNCASADDSNQSKNEEDERRPSEKITTAPEPPRWRFVNEAKKSLGYSSLHAGSYIKGKSSDELGAKYVAPDISLYKQKKEEIQAGNVVYQLPTNNGAAKENVDVGKLNANIPPQNAFSLGQNKVGKIQIRQASSTEGQLPTGLFAGLRKSEGQTNEPRKPFKEWDASYQVGPRQGRDHEWYDGKVQESYTMPGSVDPNTAHGEVGKLQFHGSGSGTEAFNGDIAKRTVNGSINRSGGDNFSDNDYGDSREGTLFIQRNGATNSIQSHEVIDASESLTEISINEEKRKKKQRCLYILLLLLLALVVILGVLLGRKYDDDEEQSAMAVGSVGGVLLPPALVAAENDTNVPSFQPSPSPSNECPLGTKPFTIEHLQRSRLEQQPSSSSVGEATWRIKDACTGEVLAKCLPCLNNKKTLNPGNAMAQSRSNELDNLLKDTTECLPIGEEFAFEVLPVTENTGKCCGFDPAMSIFSYDNMVIQLGASRESIFSGSDDTDQVYFGETETSCTSQSPSISPTLKGSEVPSLSPSVAPSTSPSTSPPTKSPAVFLGGCPETYTSFTSYVIGTQVELDGIIYECTSSSCGSYGFEPGSSTSSLWRQGWDIVGSCEGTWSPTSKPTTPPSRSPSRYPTPRPSEMPTKAPTPAPSQEPTPRQRTSQPTNRPTPKPTCSIEQDFNLCLAIDMSGSVCNDGTGSECTNCQSTSFLATFLPSFFGSECRDSYVDEATCCNNFANVKQFSGLMVDLLGDFPSEKSFSVVQFSTYAQRVSSLASADQTVQVINQLDYTGGMTNHAAAIQTCQQTMPSFSSRKNFMMIITDGVSSEPGIDPEGAAELAASAAKLGGTFIIPVFISPRGNDWSALAFMRRLSSDGKVFDVSDFDSLNSLQDVLIDQVSCA